MSFSLGCYFTPCTDNACVDAIPEVPAAAAGEELATGLGPTNSSRYPDQAAAWTTEHHNQAGIQLRYCAPSSLLLLTAGPGTAVHGVPPQDWAGFDFQQALEPNSNFELRTETGAYHNQPTCHCDVPVVSLPLLPRAHCPPHRLSQSTRDLTFCSKDRSIKFIVGKWATIIPSRYKGNNA